MRETWARIVDKVNAVSNTRHSQEDIRGEMTYGGESVPSLPGHTMRPWQLVVGLPGPSTS